MFKKIILLTVAFCAMSQAAAPDCSSIESNFKTAGSHLWQAGSHGFQMVSHVCQAVPPFVKAGCDIVVGTKDFVVNHPAIIGTLLFAGGSVYMYAKVFNTDNRRR